MSKMTSTADKLSAKIDSAVDNVEGAYDSCSRDEKEQLLIGSATGLLCGHFTAKSGPWVAAAGALGLIAMQYARQKGYLRMDGNTWRSDAKALGSKVRRQLDQLYDPKKPQLKVFVERNVVILTSYAACVLLGAIVTSKLL